MKQKKHIIFSSYDDIHNPYYRGGGAQTIHEIAKRLAREYHVTVITGTYPSAQNEVVDRISYVRIGASFLGPKLGHLAFHLLLPFHVLFRRFDLWIESFTPPFSTGFLQLFTKKPVIGTAHMLSAQDMQRKYKLPFPIVENIGLRTYRYFIAVTDHLKEKIQHINPQSVIETIPNAVASVKRTVQRKEKHILYLGRIEINQKGLDLLLDAFKKAGTTLPFPLVIAGHGTGKETARLQRLIREKGLSSSVSFVGRVEGKEKTRLLADSAYVVMPSRFESFGIVALEALSYEKPVITFALPMLAWIPKDCSLKAKCFSSVSLANALQELGSNKTKRRTMGKAGGVFAKEYTWDSVLNKYEEFIEKVVKEKKTQKHFYKLVDTISLQ